MCTWVCFHPCVLTMLLLWLFVSVMLAFCPFSRESDPLHAYSPGDIMIGGLFPIHTETNRSITHGPLSCSSYDFRTFLHSQVMIYAIREINQRMPRVLPNFTLGYDIYDTCGDVSIAISATLQLLRNQSDLQRCFLPDNFPSALLESQTKAVIGERYSEVSVAVARVFALSSAAQISYASTSGQLSTKLKFPTFLRIVSSDKHQTMAIAELVKKFNWTTVAIVGSDDEYGEYGSNSLEKIFNERKVCIEFVNILPASFSKNTTQSNKRLAELVDNINKSSVEAIIMFTKDTNVRVIMEEAIKHNFNRTWIAGDTWSTSQDIYTLPGIEKAGQVFGFTFKRNDVPNFKDHVLSNFNGTPNDILSHHRNHYPPYTKQSDNNRKCNCSQSYSQQGSNKQCLDPSCLVEYIDRDESYNIYLAVQVIVEGLRSLLKCDNVKCKHSGKFTALQLLEEIKKVNFTVNTTHIFFDQNGDPSLGYDIVHWIVDESKQETHIKSIGEYWPEGKIKIFDEDLVKKKADVTEAVFNCSKTCEPGYEKKPNIGKCCYGCFKCENGYYSAGNGNECKHCSEDQYSSPKRDTCFNKTVEFLQWSDPFVIILSCFQVFGIIVCIVFTILFAIYRDTPVVKAVGGYLCFLELFSLLTCFCIAFSFTGYPEVISCMVGMPVFGMAFSLCISCILANLLQILVGFNFDLNTGSWIKKLNQPVLVVIIGSGIQVVLCVIWLYFDPPAPSKKKAGNRILHECSHGSLIVFILTLSYNAFLALICFLFAFRGKKLPDLYKNASLVTTSMILFLVVWIVFIPVYISSIGKYTRADEKAAILISSYSILGCHLAPKCYIMVFKKEINDQKAIAENIRKHYEQKNLSVVTS